ncbi:MAG: hypothetical protein NC402_00090 [Prevotella sp.]|nr:hypothetical protein [Prevotella sp.]MCM1074409.1 hypothetical protein [Ruminococcus sp.]
MSDTSDAIKSRQFTNPQIITNYFHKKFYSQLRLRSNMLYLHSTSQCCQRCRNGHERQESFQRGCHHHQAIKGILLEQENNDREDIRRIFEKAIQLDPDNFRMLYHYGRFLYSEACLINDNAPTDDTAYAQIYYGQIQPLLRRAAEILEKSACLDLENSNPIKLLEQTYYMLGDEEKLVATRARLNR